MPKDWINRPACYLFAECKATHAVEQLRKSVRWVSRGIAGRGAWPRGFPLVDGWIKKHGFAGRLPPTGDRGVNGGVLVLFA